jgi:predicted DNA-binding ribbon-helix-helix protein
LTRSLGVPESSESAQSRAGRLIKKNRQFLAKRAATWYCFSERPISPASTFHGRRATETLALRAGNDSGMASQAIEIAQNGLGDPPARGRWEGESIRRVPDARVVKRSLVIAGHRTSVSLEDAFWRRLQAIAAQRGLSLKSLAAIIDASRDGANLSSAIRVFVLEAEGAQPVPPSR